MHAQRRTQKPKSEERDAFSRTGSQTAHFFVWFAWAGIPSEKDSMVGKPLTSTLLTSTFVFRSGWFSLRGFELEWSLVATFLEGFSVTSHETTVPGARFKGLKRVRGHPGTKKSKWSCQKSGR